MAGPQRFRPLARHGRLPTPGLASFVLKALGLALAVLLVSGVSIAAVAYGRVAAQIDANKVDLGGSGAVPSIGAHSGTVNLLLVGSDSRNGQKGHYGENPGSTLNDVNILLHISQDHTKAEAISFPRDLYVDVPACRDPSNGRLLPPETSVKINTTLEYGGVGCTRDTIQRLTGMQIPYVGLISFDGVVEMSNAVGGVPVCVASPINDDYTDLHLTKGVHVLQGTTALKFLRTRHGVGDGSDVTRISSQQVFLSALVRKMKSTSTLTDVTKLYGLATAAADSMTLSTTLANVDTMVSIAEALAPISLSKFVLVQYPTKLTLDGSGLEPNTEPDKVLIDAVKGDKTLRLAAKQKGATEGSGSVVQGQMPSTGSPSPSPSASASSSPSPSPSSSPSSSGDGVDLPDTVTGQTAGEQTCSVGNDLGRR
ncbi:LCP family protein [Amnibacterium sp. CER49]|uniref:LCP family protein n=1 Tax=Amnibacterium sp. CER49 TaxID=3039161 RepID=UPI002449E66C|nr:LCP family protein [Amnibacterium sp. CER49]MDH2443485.1 LCP family protein [Amnibacterium sp. CER49]